MNELSGPQVRELYQMKMKLTLALALSFLVTGPAIAGDQLGIGDPAPELSITKWVKGPPVDLSAQKGKGVVVVEFWATWCRQCIQSIPDLTHLQREYAGKNVSVIGVTSQNERNTLEDVEKFVNKQGDKIGYAIASEKDNKTYDAYMTASGQMGIPTSFVIDRKGRIAWIGHPMAGLDDVVSEVVAGTFDMEVAKKVAAIEKRLFGVSEDLDTRQTLKILDEWIALQPQALTPYMMQFSTYASDLKDRKKAASVATKAIRAMGEKPRNLAVLAGELVSEGNEHVYDELAKKAIEQAFGRAPDDASVIISRFAVMAATGREEEAMVWAEIAIDKLKGDASALHEFAKTIADPERTSRCNSLAVRAVDLALAAEPDNAAHLQAKFSIQANCQKNINAAKATGRYLIEKAADDGNTLNNFAWALLTEDGLKGKFNELALAAAERCDKVTESKSWAFLDTYALASFEAGKKAEAIRLQKKAIEACDLLVVLPELRERLAEFGAAKD